MSDDIDALKEAEKEKSALTDVNTPPYHITHKEEDHHHWLGGVILITVGAALLLTTVLGVALHNWWALFILVPGLSKLICAAQSLQRDGRFSPDTRSNFTWGLILILVACTFFFSWSWNAIWPLFLIILGISALLSGILEQKQ